MEKEIVLYFKPIWMVTFNDGGRTPTREQRVAAYNLYEVLSYYNEEGHKSIVKIEKTKEEISYKA